MSALDKHRYINVEHNWWDCVVDHWVEKLERKGYYDVDIQFSGFCSQGDGASFTARISGAGVRKFMELHGLDKTYKHVYAIAEPTYVRLSMDRTSTRYSHEHTVAPDGEMEEVYEPDDPTDLREEALYRLSVLAGYEWADFVEQFGSISRDYMREIYDDLETDYNYLTSDEAVRETLNINNIAV